MSDFSTGFFRLKETQLSVVADLSLKKLLTVDEQTIVLSLEERKKV